MLSPPSFLLPFKHTPKGPNIQKRPADVIGNAVHVLRIATGRDWKEPGGPKVAGKTYRHSLVRCSYFGYITVSEL
jgi:hypothetical protein